MILIIDNYDSFTYNLVQRIGELDSSIELQVFRNDKITVSEAQDLGPERVIISPGPCTPLEAGISNEMVKHFAGKVPLLGVCLGHQCIAHSFGASIVRADRLMHGKTSMIGHDGKETRIHFRDDGPGYPAEMLAGDFGHAGVGFDLVHGIVRKSLRGSVELRNDEGALTIISFENEVLPDEEETGA